MKRKLTLTDIAGYLDHPLIGQHPTGAICWIDVEFIAQHGISLAGYKPVLRPMSDLYVEITDKDYNGGEPFVPIVELAKARHHHFSRFKFNAAGQFVACKPKDNSISIWYTYDRDRLSFAEFDLLHRLKLDYRGLIDAGLAVSVHDLKRNPYEE